MKASTAAREERQALATLALMGFVVGVCLQPVVHNLHHRDDHIHGASGAARSTAATAPAVNPWAQHAPEQKPASEPVHEHKDGSSDLGHGDGSLLHHGLALHDGWAWAGLPPSTLRFVLLGHQHARAAWDTRLAHSEAWPQGPPA